MASTEKIKDRIREIAGRPNNVTTSDIEWVMNRLEDFAPVQVTGNVHQRLYVFEGLRFSVCPHIKGSKQLKRVYVKNFLQVMIETGWYE
jgi:hypothetical protein